MLLRGLPSGTGVILAMLLDVVQPHLGRESTLRRIGTAAYERGGGRCSLISACPTSADRTNV